MITADKSKQVHQPGYREQTWNIGRLSGDESRRSAKVNALKAEAQRRNTSLITTILTCAAVLAFVAATILAAIYVPQVAIYVPIIALALALALQK